MDFAELIGGVIAFVVGVIILTSLTSALAIPLGTLIIAVFIIGGIIWFIRQVMG